MNITLGAIMSLEYFLIIVPNIFSAFSLFYVPKASFRKALLSFLTFQAATWFVSLILVQLNILAFPVRLFKKATRSNFLNEFLLYPIIFMWFVLLYPKNKSSVIKIMHHIIFISILTWYMYFLNTYTSLSKPITILIHPLALDIYARVTIVYEVCYFYIKLFSNKKHLT
jgi:hypothetical protein